MICTPLAASRRTFDAPAPLAGEIAPSSPIRCLRLHATLPARICLLRQLVTDRQRPTVVGLRSAVGRRCSVSVFPSCDTATCSQGRAVREALDPARAQTWRGRGLGGRFDGGRGDLAAQLAAHARLRLVGMLEVVPSCDDEPPEEQG